jgi:PAS domain S-box-containing protein
MAASRKTNPELQEEIRHLRAQIAQLEDKLDHVTEHGSDTKAIQQLHREVMAAVSEVVLITDEAGRLTYVSPNAHLVFGHTAADIRKQGRICFILPKDLFDPDLLEQRGEITNINTQIRDSVGRARNLLITVRTVASQPGKTLYVCRDVTERIKIELDHELLSLTMEKQVDEQTREIRESRDQYRRLVEGLREEYMFFASDPDGIITYCSPSSYSILGRRPDEAVGHNWREFVNNEGEEFAELERMEQLRFAGLETPRYTVPIPHVNGEMRMMEFRSVPVVDKNGKVIANEGIGKDVTARHAAEEALRKAHEKLEERVRERTAELTAKNDELRQTQERYLSVIQDHLEFIIRWRDDGIRTFVNESYCNYCQASADELNETSFMTSIVEEDRAQLLEKLSTVSIEKPVVVHEHRTITSDNRTVWEHWTHRALYNSEGQLIEFQSVGCDVTERRKREEHAEEFADASTKLGALTAREYDVMRLVVAGDANKVVARKLGLSIKTIEKHRSSLMKKLNVRSVPELVRFALLVESVSAEEPQFPSTARR